MHAPASTGLDPIQFLQALWKQRTWWALLWLLATAAVLAAVWLIPPRYKVEALLVLEFDPPAPRTTTGFSDALLRSRLELAKLRVLRREGLLQLLRQADPKLVSRWKSDQAPREIERYRSSIRVSTVPESRTGVFSGVRVIFEGRNPESSAALVNGLAVELAREFERYPERIVDAKRLEPQVAAAWNRLAECQDALKAFETEHGTDPERRRRLLLADQDSLQTEAVALERSLREVKQERLRLEQTINLAEQELARAPSSPPIRTPPPAAVETARRMRERLAALLVRYKESHPDVRRLRQELAGLGVLQGPPEGDGAAELKPSPGEQAEEKLVRLRGELARAEQRQRELAAERERMMQALQLLSEQIRQVTWLGRRHSALARECELAEAGYRSAVLARQQADLQAERGPVRPAPRLVLLEEALVPGRPVFPNRRLLGLLGALAALLPCAMIAACRELGAKPVLAVLGLAAQNNNGCHTIAAQLPGAEPPANGRRAAHAG